jgi:hypothetical protein
MLQAFPGTRLHERLMCEGRLTGDFSSDMIISTNVVPKQMTKAALMRGYVDLLRDLYAYDRYAERAISYLTAGRKLDPLQPGRRSRSELWALARFFLFILFGGDPERRRFSRRILLTTLRADPGRLTEAIYLVVVHKHFYEYIANCVASIEGVLEKGGEGVLPEIPASGFATEAG